MNQTVGAYLHIARMQSHNYGRYVCSIDIGNAATRLEMQVEIGGPPTEASAAALSYWSMTALQLAACAALLTVGVLVLVRYSLTWVRLWRKREAGGTGGAGQQQCQQLTAAGRRTCNNNNGTASSASDAGLLAGQQRSGRSSNGRCEKLINNRQQQHHFSNVV